MLFERLARPARGIASRAESTLRLERWRKFIISTIYRIFRIVQCDPRKKVTLRPKTGRICEIKISVRGFVSEETYFESVISESIFLETKDSRKEISFSTPFVGWRIILFRCIICIVQCRIVYCYNSIDYFTCLSSKTRTISRSFRILSPRCICWCSSRICFAHPSELVISPRCAVHERCIVRFKLDRFYTRIRLRKNVSLSRVKTRWKKKQTNVLWTTKKEGNKQTGIVIAIVTYLTFFRFTMCCSAKPDVHIRIYTYRYIIYTQNYILDMSIY